MKFKADLLKFAQATGQELSEERLRALCAFLTDYHDEQLCAALQQHAKRSQWLPAPAELMGLIDAELETVAAEQWAIAVKTFGNPGRRESLDVATHKAIGALGGWQKIGSANIERDLPFIRREFIALYSSHARRQAVQRGITDEPQDRVKQKQLTEALRASDRGSK